MGLSKFLFVLAMLLTDVFIKYCVLLTPLFENAISIWSMLQTVWQCWLM